MTSEVHNLNATSYSDSCNSYDSLGVEKLGLGPKADTFKPFSEYPLELNSNNDKARYYIHINK